MDFSNKNYNILIFQIKIIHKITNITSKLFQKFLKCSKKMFVKK